jgi:hypothetical protein
VEFCDLDVQSWDERKLTEALAGTNEGLPSMVRLSLSCMY